MATLRLHKAAPAAVHRAAGHPGRTKGKSQKQAQPLTAEALRAIEPADQLLDPPTPILGLSAKQIGRRVQAADRGKGPQRPHRHGPADGGLHHSDCVSGTPVLLSHAECQLGISAQCWPSVYRSPATSAIAALSTWKQTLAVCSSGLKPEAISAYGWM